MSTTTTYLDNNATTRLDPRVLEAMLPYLTELYGNPSSTHHFGAQVAAAIEQARGHVAALIGARETEIIFTSGGTEADNAALRGVCTARPDCRRIVISSVEHSAVDEMAARLENEGYAVTRVAVDSDGRLNLDELAAAVTEDTALVSVMLANNETGVVFPLAEVSRIAHDKGVLVHTDAVNALGKMPVDVAALGVDLLSLSGHKIYGPKGVGALYVRRGTPFFASQIGGSQERKRRGGTLNAPSIIGLGKACELLRQEHEGDAARIRPLRDQLERRLRDAGLGAHIIGAAAERLPNTTCVCFEGVEAEAVLLLLSEQGVCASSGAACSSGSLEPSRIMQAMGIDPQIAQGQLRLSLGRFSTEADVERLFEVLPTALERISALNG